MFRRTLNRLKTINFPGKSNKFIGQDLQGNLYFEGPPVREGLSKSRRSIVYGDGRDAYSQYVPHSIPVQWQAWLRHTREQPPSLDELQSDVMRQQDLAVKVQALQEKDQQEKENKEKLASPSNDFQPQTWSPKAEVNKESSLI